MAAPCPKQASASNQFRWRYEFVSAHSYRKPIWNILQLDMDIDYSLPMTCLVTMSPNANVTLQPNPQNCRCCSSQSMVMGSSKQFQWAECRLQKQNHDDTMTTISATTTTYLIPAELSNCFFYWSHVSSMRMRLDSDNTSTYQIFLYTECHFCWLRHLTTFLKLI